MINNNQSRFQILRNPGKTANFENYSDTPLVSKNYINYCIVYESLIRFHKIYHYGIIFSLITHFNQFMSF